MTHEVRRAFALHEHPADHEHIRFLGVVYRDGRPGVPIELGKPLLIPDGWFADMVLAYKGITRVEPWTALLDGRQVAEIGANNN